MKANRDPLALGAHWHLDCRIPEELPEDTLVGTRFLTHVLFTAVALGMLLFTGWLAYGNVMVGRQIRDWEQRMSDNRAEVRDIQRMQREYAAEAAKIDQAYSLVRPQFFVSGFFADLGRTRPDPMAIDIIEWNEAGIVVRGSVHANPERAMQVLGNYVEQLRRDEKIGPLFSDIRQTDLIRGDGELWRFEIKFALKTRT